MTKRRLINKKAYEELLLLQSLLTTYGDNEFIVSIQVDENGFEGFAVDHYFEEEWICKIVGENYTVISKMLIEYLSKLPQ